MESVSRRVGGYDVAILHDGVFEAPADVLVHSGGADARRDALAGWGKAAIRVDVNCFLLRHESGLTLVDAGTGSSWGEAFGHARAALAALGVTPDQVDRVLLTHLHGDHALGLFDGEAACFPRAQICVPRVELDFFTDAQARDALPESRRSGFEIAAKLQRLYGERVRTIGEGEVLPGITLLPLPGHTPGHGGYLLSDAQRSLLLWGDLLHVADLQPGDPEIGVVYDLDAVTAVQSRRSGLARAAREGWIVSGGHVAGFQQVRPAGSGYALVPA